MFLVSDELVGVYTSLPPTHTQTRGNSHASTCILIPRLVSFWRFATNLGSLAQLSVACYASIISQSVSLSVTLYFLRWWVVYSLSLLLKCMVILFGQRPRRDRWSIWIHTGRFSSVSGLRPPPKPQAGPHIPLRPQIRPLRPQIRPMRP